MPHRVEKLRLSSGVEVGGKRGVVSERYEMPTFTLREVLRPGGVVEELEP